MIGQVFQPVIKWYTQFLHKKNRVTLDGTLEAGVKAPVEISRDEWGVAHIFAQNERDAFFAQAYVHAQDRLWQLELNRRLASGRLSEFAGKETLHADRIVRTLGFRRIAAQEWEHIQKEAPELRLPVEAYTEGINHFLETCTQLPTEFVLLKLKPEPWTVIDTLAIARFLTFQMSYGWLHELQRMELAAILGADKAAELHPHYPSLNPEAMRAPETFRITSDALEAFKGPYLAPLGGSNNWVVAGNKMEDGRARLCNDPHLLMSMPALWYENHLCAPELEVTGFSFIGAPLVLIGHNRKIGWGITLSFADIQDTYIEKFTGPQCLQYHFGTRILKSTQHEEKILVKGQKKPHIERIISTHHGPLISGVMNTANHKIALASQALKPNLMMRGFYAMNKAEGWNAFVTACKHIEAPSLNIVYTDTDENIGYYMTGKVPIREKSKSLGPRLGWKQDYEWTDFVPFEKMPHAFNPTKGYFYTCNHKIVTDDYPYDLGALWMNGYRAHRLQMLFDEKDKYTPADFQAWQTDVYSVPGKALQAIFKEFAASKYYMSRKQIPTRAKEAFEAFLDWDGFLGRDSVGGAVYQVLKQQLITIIFEAPLRDIVRGIGSNAMVQPITEFFGYDTVTLLRILEDKESAWTAPEREALLWDAFLKTSRTLEKQLGRQVTGWHWGKLHRITFGHAFGAQAKLEKAFNEGPHAIPGDTDTLWQTAFPPGNPQGTTTTSASFRQILNPTNWADSQSIMPCGQAANPQSPFYKNQLTPWLKGELKPMLWTRAQIQEHQAHHLVLKPTPKA